MGSGVGKDALRLFVLGFGTGFGLLQVSVVSSVETSTGLKGAHVPLGRRIGDIENGLMLSLPDFDGHSFT